MEEKSQIPGEEKESTEYKVNPKIDLGALKDLGSDFLSITTRSWIVLASLQVANDHRGLCNEDDCSIYTKSITTATQLLSVILAGCVAAKVHNKSLDLSDKLLRFGKPAQWKDKVKNIINKIPKAPTPTLLTKYENSAKSVVNEVTEKVAECTEEAAKQVKDFCFKNKVS